MRLKPLPLDIPDDNPFKNDGLGRKALIEDLARFVSSIQEPFVIALDGTWGTGKTTFVQMWQKHLRLQGVHSLYFNAWENDFTDDPLVALIAETSKLIEQMREGKRSAAQNILNKVNKYAGLVARAALPTALSIATHGALKLSSETESSLAGLLQGAAEKAVANYEKSKETITDLKKELTKFVEEVRTNHESADKPSPPVVFFIDELDRCRPLYAIQLLERVKHLFDTPGLVFVISMAKDQLGHSLKCVYGDGMDVDGYLRRFIDIEYHLPKPKSGQYERVLYDRFELEDFFGQRQGELSTERRGLGNYMPKWCALFGLELRDQEKCYTHLAIACSMTPRNQYLLPHFLGFLIILKLKNSSLYRDYVRGNAGFEEVIGFVSKQPEGTRFLSDTHGPLLEGMVLGGLQDSNGFRERIEHYKEQQKASGAGQEHERCERILRAAYAVRTDYSNEPLIRQLAARIDIATAFHE